MRSLLTLAPLVLAVPAVYAQNLDIEDPGSFPVGVQDVSFQSDLAANFVRARIYYPATSAGSATPADPSGGPYPLVGFMHGWTGSTNDYDDICTHLASWGYLVGSINTETGFFANALDEAKDTRALLYWMEEESADAASFLFGMASTALPWSASGHSMGGGACYHLINIEPRIEVLMPLQPYKGGLFGGTGAAFAALPNYTGALMNIAGGADATVTPATQVYPYYLKADSASRNFYFRVTGMGHGGPTDTPSTSNPMPAADQHRLHRRLMVAFLEAQIHGDEDRFFEIVGQGMDSEPVTRESTTLAPPLWVATSTTDPTAVVTGLAGIDGDAAAIAVSTGQGPTPTAFGSLDIDLANSILALNSTVVFPGYAEAELSVPASLSGTTVYIQGFTSPTAGDVRLTRSTSFALP